MLATKSSKRLEIAQRIMNELKTPEVFNTVKYKEISEDKIKLAQYPHLLEEVAKMYEQLKGIISKNAKERARKALLWEGNKNTTINNVLFFGTYHRPDLVLEFDDNLRIAIEIKRGENGEAIRDGIGQAITYTASGAFDFTVILFVDISKDGKILNSITSERESKFIEKLWNDNNVLFGVI